MIEKKQVIFEDFKLSKYIIATRHANGRDWWIIAPNRNSDLHHLCLLSPEGVQRIGTQAIGTPESVYWGGQTGFSPDGSLYFKAYQDGIRIMDFDRCTGTLSNFRFLYHPGPAGAGGLAVSPSGRYLYTTNGTYLSQYDLWATDIEASGQVVATYDGFQSPFNTAFYQGRLAPDGKIYFSTGSTNNVMHIIHYPDRPGPACGVEQHGLILPALMGFWPPNFANYRLGPLDGSACDTLGLDNLPQAWWLPEADSADARSVFFRDLSYFEPSHWSWDFGDGSPASTEPSPDHSFSGPGLYTVCLTVSNANGTDTHCETLRVGLTAQENLDWAARFEIWPNPFEDQLQLLLSPGLPSPVLRLYDATGRLLRSLRLTPGVQDIDTTAWPPGFYVWELSARGERVKTGKLVK